MWLLLLACGPPVTAPTAEALVAAGAEAGWVRRGCSAYRTEGVATTRCTLEADDGAVAVVTALTYDRAGDAARAWAASDAAGWQTDRVAVQVDVLRPDVARDVVTRLPAEAPLRPADVPGWSVRCAEGRCQGTRRGLELLVVEPAPSRVPPGHVVDRERLAVVSDQARAQALVAQLRRSWTDATSPAR